MKNKSDYFWFAAAVGGCCLNAFLYGETGAAISAAGALINFAGYSLITAVLYRRNLLRRRLNR